jgi:hypothetical protein
MPARLDTAGARAALDSITGSPDVADGYLELPACPLDPTGSTLTALVADLDAPPIALAVGGRTLASVYATDTDPELELSCDRAHEDAGNDGIGLFAMAPPADFAAFSDEVANPDRDPAVTVTVEPSRADRGGRYVRVCVDDGSDAVFDYCEVVWIGGDLLVGAYVAGAGSTEVDLDVFEAALASQLETIVASLAG